MEYFYFDVQKVCFTINLFFVFFFFFGRMRGHKVILRGDCLNVLKTVKGEVEVVSLEIQHIIAAVLAFCPKFEVLLFSCVSRNFF